ncbi:hypothetical protein GGQ24_17150 [Nocardioides sp. zg-578]|nr:hypothetical protein [Nocardioides marmotae]
MDVDRIRACFPALDLGVAHFDGPGGSQVRRQAAGVVVGRSMTQLTAELDELSRAGVTNIGDRQLDSSSSAASAPSLQVPGNPQKYTSPGGAWGDRRPGVCVGAGQTSRSDEPMG